VRALSALITNEFERMLRHRWLLMVIPYAIALVGYGIFVGVELHNGYQFGSHPPLDWRSNLKTEMAQAQQQLASAQQQQAQAPQPGRGGAFAAAGIGREISALQTAIRDDQYHLDHNAPPPTQDLVTAATSVSLNFGMFVLTLVIGWLAAEMIAEERSHRTMTLLLARPISRTQLLVAKAVTAIAVGSVLVVIAVALGYVLTVIFAGNFGDPSTNLIVLKDGSQPLSDSNAVVMSSMSVLAVEFGVSLVSVVCLVGMSLLLSSLFKSAGVAIAVTLGFLFVIPGIVNAVAGGASAIFGIEWVAQVVQYLWFTNFEPAGAVVGTGAAGPNTGLNHLGVSVPVLLAWAVVFYVGAWLLLTKRDEVST
jgi:ABC-2 type transport system permease protein